MDLYTIEFVCSGLASSRLDVVDSVAYALNLARNSIKI